jgi:hypothetical protein
LAKFLSSYFIFDAIENGIAFQISFESLQFVVGVQKSYWFLYVDIVFCYFADSVYQI